MDYKSCMQHPGTPRQILNGASLLGVFDMFLMALLWTINIYVYIFSTSLKSFPQK